MTTHTIYPCEARRKVGRTLVDLTIRLVDERDRTITTTSYPVARTMDAARIGENYRQGWNDRGRAMFGDSFSSHADGFQVHDESGNILAYG